MFCVLFFPPPFPLIKKQGGEAGVDLTQIQSTFHPQQQADFCS